MPCIGNERSCRKTPGFGRGDGKVTAIPVRVIPVLCAAALCLTLSGCFDVFHYITRLDNGADRHVLKMTVLTSAGELADISEEELRESLDEGNFFSGIGDYKKYGGRVEIIADEYEAGYLVKMDLLYDESTVDRIIREDPDFIPLYTQEGMTIPLQNIAASMDEEERGLLFGFGRYRLMISKRCLPEITAAAAVRHRSGKPVFSDSPAVNLAVLDLGDRYLIDIPLALFAGDYRFLKLYTN